MLFVHAAKGAWVIAHRRPHAFCRIGVDLTNTIAIVVACAFVNTMIDGDMRPRDVIVALPVELVTMATAIGGHMTTTRAAEAP